MSTETKLWNCQACDSLFQVPLDVHMECKNSPSPRVASCTKCGGSKTYPWDAALGREQFPSWFRFSVGGL